MEGIFALRQGNETRAFGFTSETTYVNVIFLLVAVISSKS